jgi:hypothetical protein
MRRITVVHIGSTKFHAVFDRMNVEDTLAGKIVLTVGCVTQPDSALFAGRSVEDMKKIKVKLDQLHLEKIDRADEVLLLNVNGYIGRSTLHELCYAYNHQKHIRWLEDQYVMYCSQCEMAGFEKDHFFHTALSLDELDDILGSDNEAAIEHVVGRIANWHGEMAPVVRLESGVIALEIDLTCSQCEDTHETGYVISGCHYGAFCYVADEQGHFLADLRNQSFVCGDCAQSDRPKASDDENTLQPSWRSGYVPVMLLHQEELALEASAERQRLHYE